MKTGALAGCDWELGQMGKEESARCLCQPLPPGGGLRDDGGQPPSVPVSGHHPRLQAELHARLRAHILQQQLHFVRLIDEHLRAGAPPRIALVQLHADLLRQAWFVEIKDPGQQSSRPNATKAAMDIEETDLSPRSGGSDGGGDPGRPGTTHDHIRILHQLQITRWFAENPFRHLRNLLPYQGDGHGASQGGVDELAAGIG
jgi:hypothetical protein